MTEVQTAVVEQTIRIAARPETVWSYWTDPDLLREWWGTATAYETAAGGDWEIRMPEGPVMGGEFVELVPHERIVFTFGWVPAAGLPEIAVGSTRRNHPRGGRGRHGSDAPSPRHPCGPRRRTRHRVGPPPRRPG